MKKTILASAIAAASFSGAAFAQESNLPTVYGNIQYAITHDNVDGGPSELEHTDNGSTLGVKHDHEIAPGLSGFFKLELEGLNADDKDAENDNAGLNELDEAYVGVNSDSFGKVWIGSDDSTYERAIVKIANFYEVATLSQGSTYETGEGDLVQYESPSFGGLTLGAAVQVNGDGDSQNEGAKSYPYQLAAIYSVDALELAFAMDSNDGAAGSNDENTYGLRGTYTMGDLSVSGEFQTRKDVKDQFGVHGVYTVGPNQFALSYELSQFDDEIADVDQSTITLQALHNLSDNMYIYAEGYIGGGDDVYDYNYETVGSSDFDSNVGVSDERTVAAVGAVYYF